MPDVEQQAPGIRTTVREATADGVSVAQPGRLLIRLIRAGWSLNANHYSADVLRAAAANRAWPKGTLCYADHATDEEEAARPAGSIRNLAAVLTTDARWDEGEQALMAEARLFAPWRESITDMASAIGMSIRAWVTGEEGEVGGQSGFVVSEIIEGRSVDFVTVPAAGGGIVSVLEAVGNRMPTAEASSIGARIEAKVHTDWTVYADELYADGRLTRAERITLSSAVGDALAAFTARVEQDAPGVYARDLYDEIPDAEPTAMEEAPTDETRAALTNAIRAAYADADSKTWAWLKDFDPDKSIAWFEVDNPEGSTCWEQAYTVASDGTATLLGQRIEVQPHLVYRPVARGSGYGAEAAEPTTQTATAVAENVSDGAPPTAPNTPTEEEPVSGTQTGAPPVEAGTATVVDAPPANTTIAAPAQEAVQPHPQTVAALEAVTAQLAETQKALAALNARADQRDAENRALRNNARASEAVTAALRAPEFADVAAQIGPRVSARVLAAVPTTAEGAVDETKLAEAITAAAGDEATYVRTARAEALEAAGFGVPRGLGATPAAEAVDDGFDAELTSFFGDVLGMTTEQAKIATKGRVS
jgi:hypothetical protein